MVQLDLQVLMQLHGSICVPPSRLHLPTIVNHSGVHLGGVAQDMLIQMVSLVWLLVDYLLSINVQEYNQLESGGKHDLLPERQGGKHDLLPERQLLYP